MDAAEGAAYAAEGADAQPSGPQEGSEAAEAVALARGGDERRHRGYRVLLERVKHLPTTYQQELSATQ